MLVALLHFLLQLALLVDEHFLHLELFLFLEDFGLLLGGLHHLLIFSRQHITEHQISADTSQSECACGN